MTMPRSAAYPSQNDGWWILSTVVVNPPPAKEEITSIRIESKYHTPAILALLRGDDFAISAFVISKFSRFDLTSLLSG
jgi:hypothetical protein